MRASRYFGSAQHGDFMTQVKQPQRHSTTIIPQMTTHPDRSRAETWDDFWHPRGPTACKACSRAFGPPASTAANHKSQHG
jgi:hypothetical protein